MFVDIQFTFVQNKSEFHCLVTFPSLWHLYFTCW